MDIEFHYYITYILADKAGFSRNDAATIAYASQHTDDNTYHYCINFEKENPYLNIVSQTMDITKPQEKRKTIYPIFHFFPGDSTCATAARKDGRTHPFNTTPDSPRARDMFKEALATKDPYRIGIATHVYADTWAHQNFCGLKDDFNAIAEPGNIFIPNIGHADARTNPDMIGHEWVDKRLVEEHAHISNNGRFMEAAEKIFHAFRRHQNPAVDDSALAESWGGVKSALKEAMNARSVLGDVFHLSQRERIEAYRGICSDMPVYEAEQWRHDAVIKDEFEVDFFDKYWAGKDFPTSPWYRFQEAARTHHDYAVKILGSLYD